MKNKLNSSSVHLMTVPNNDVGRNVIKEIRLHGKQSGSPVRLALYGRGHRYGKGRIHVRDHQTHSFDNSFQSHLPMNLASHIAVYLVNRKGQ